VPVKTTNQLFRPTLSHSKPTFVSFALSSRLAAPSNANTVSLARLLTSPCGPTYQTETTAITVDRRQHNAASLCNLQPEPGRVSGIPLARGLECAQHDEFGQQLGLRSLIWPPMASGRRAHNRIARLHGRQPAAAAAAAGVRRRRCNKLCRAAPLALGHFPWPP
jgi:hypothetical protein